MKEKLKQERGVSLISLTIAVIVILAITGMMIYNSRDSVYIKNLTNMYNDVSNLRDKISEYYSQYGDIPIAQKYTNTNHLNKVKGANDTGDFYVIDVSAIDNLTLNYGKDFEKIKNITSQEKIDSNKDLYIINYNSHNVFYVKGIEYDVNGEIRTYYTDDNNPDEEKVVLKYVDGIKIPENATYVEGDKNSGIKIKIDGTQYIWRVLTEELTTADDFTIDESKVSEFLKSANAYGGFYQENVEEDPKVNYLSLDEEDSWLYYYDTEGKYKDDNGEEVYIPAKCSVSTNPSINKVSEGLVIRDENKNEYVWISVPKSITAEATSDEEIETALKKYTEEFRKEGTDDVWHEGLGLNESQYLQKKSAMLNSIKENGGFYIARYEMGVSKNGPKISSSTGTIEELIQTNGIPNSKKNQYPYNYVTCSQAEQLSEKIAPEGRTSSLMFGVQWDLILKLLYEKGLVTLEEITTKSTTIGNYKDADFDITRGKYSSDSGVNWTTVSGTYNKPETTSRLLTTGATERNSTLNIYDLAGNVIEYTLEINEEGQGAGYYVGRGGYYSNSGTSRTLIYRSGVQINNSSGHYGFRSTIY